MYRLTYEDYILYDPRLATPEDRLTIRDPKVHLAVDKAGEMSFLLQPEHPYVDKLRKMSGVVELTDGATPIYRGRITRDTIDFYGVHTVETEGLLACLNDSIIEPFAYPEDFTEDTGYQEAAASGNVVEYLFYWLLGQHNAQVSVEQQLKPGTCTVTDPNNYITRSSTDYQTTMEAIRGKLFGSSLGGHLLIRYEADGNYLDYYADLPLTNTQPVEFAANLLDLTTELDGTDIYTAILPLGKDGLTIAELSDTDLTDDLVKSGKIIYSKSGIAAHGRITRCIKWDDVTVPANLQTKAKAALADNGLAMPETITVRAVDLGWQDAVQHFRIGRMTLLASTPHGYRASYPLLELSPDILDPGNTQITMGATRATYTGTQIEEDRRRDEETNRREENIKEDTRQQLDQVTESTIQQITDVQQSLNSIILTALQNYVETGEFGSYKEEMSSKLELLADKLSINITKVTNRIDKVDGDLQSKYSEITKAFRFTDEGLFIGETGNEILLRLDNDVMQFIRNNTPELMLTADGVETHQVKVTILIIGNVAFMADGSGDVVVKGVK